MFKEKKEEKEKKEKTMQEAMVVLSKSMKEVCCRLEKLEQQKPQTTEPVKPEVPEEKKPVTEEKLPQFVVQDIATKTKAVIYDISDKENPKALDLHAAVVEILNKITKVEKALA